MDYENEVLLLFISTSRYNITFFLLLYVNSIHCDFKIKLIICVQVNLDFIIND
jgi:hypothetical protein